MFSIHLDGHNMTVIEVDGTDIAPYPLDVVTMSAAQRVSVLVTALNSTDTNYLLHADMVGACLYDQRELSADTIRMLLIEPHDVRCSSRLSQSQYNVKHRIQCQHIVCRSSFGRYH